MKDNSRRFAALILGLVMLLTICFSATAATREGDRATNFTVHSHEEELGYIPDYFAEHGIDTTNHIPLASTRTTAQLTTMINSTYPNGSYYSTTGKACSSHASCIPPSASGTVCVNGCGTCKAYEASIQCQAFARLAYRTRNGKSITTGQTSTSYSITDSIISSNFTAGTMVRLKTSGGTIHSVLIVANNTSTKKVSIYHANYGGRCKVAYQTVTYADFTSAFPTYYYYCKP